jgi:hypothetical protein
VALWAKEASDNSARQLSPSILKEKPDAGGTGEAGHFSTKSAPTEADARQRLEKLATAGIKILYAGSVASWLAVVR